MHQLIPDFILNNYVSGQLNGEFKAVVLFADITGFSAMTDNLMDHGQHGAEVLASMMRLIFEPMISSVYQHQGFIPTLAGDAITAVFPFNQSESVYHALASACEMQAALRKRTPFQSDYGEFDITARVGIAIGEIEWAIIQSNDDLRAAYYFRGQGIEQSSFIEQQAQPGQIVVDEELSQRLAGLAILEPFGSFFRVKELVGELPAAIPYTQQDFEPVQVSHFFPPDLIHQSYDGEFRQVVNLFINLPTIRTRSQLRIFMRIIFQLQDKFGGLLNRLDFGDKGAHILLFWGAPRAYETDIEQALDFALALQEETSIPIHAGITYQISHAGFIGSNLREEFTCYGRGINLAARLMVAAPRGEIWVDHNIAACAKSQFHIEFLEERKFKGFTEPQRVYSLRERIERVVTIFNGDLVGRQTELNQLHDFLKPLETGEFCGALVVSGEAGIGKSRLIHELKHLHPYSEDRFYWATCQTKQYMREAFNPLRYWMRQYFGISELQAESRNKRNFNQRLDDLIFSIEDSHLIEELDRTRSFLGALLGLLWPDSLYAETGAQIRYENTLSGLSALLQALSNLQPVILLIEDVHWLDADSLKFIEYLFSKLEKKSSQNPIAILATARPGDQEHLLGNSFPCAKIFLKQLNINEIIELSAQVLSSPAAPNLIQILGERTSGNPFFIEQILRYLLDRDLLVDGENGWEMNHVEAIPLPADVRSVLLARLDHLELEEKQAVQYASILGREFDLPVLANMLKNVPDFNVTLARCENKSIWTGLDENRYIFNHALLQDAAYHMQTRDQRSRLHATAVIALESIFATELDSHYAELASHCKNAGQFDDAFYYYQHAALRAVQNYSNQEAITYYTDAINLVKKVSPEPKLVAQLHSDRGHVFELTGAFDQARADYETSQQIAFRVNDSRISWENYGDLGRLWSSRDYQLTHAYYKQALEFARKTGEPSLVGTSLNWMGNWHTNNENPSQAIELHLEALEIFKKLGDSQQIAHTSDFLGIGYLINADLNTSLGFYSDAIQIFRELNDRPGLITSLMGRGANTSCLYLLSSIPPAQNLDATEDFTEAIQIARTIGSPYLEIGPYWVLGLLNIVRGDFRNAYRAIQSGYQLSKELHHREWYVSNLYALGVYYCELFMPEEALAYLNEALELAQELKSQVWFNWVSSALGNVYILKNDFSSAQEWLAKVATYPANMDTLARRNSWTLQARLALIQQDPQQSLEITHRLIDSTPGMKPGEIVTYLWLLKGAALAELGKTDHALEYLHQAGQNASQAGEIFLLWRVQQLRARLLGSVQRNREAKREYFEAEEQIRMIATTIDNQKLKSSFLAGTKRDQF